MTKNFEVKAGYYEWNILCNGKIIYSFSIDFEEYVGENPTLRDIYEIATDWTDAMFEDLRNDKYSGKDYRKIVKELTKVWANHLCVDYGKDFESSYFEIVGITKIFTDKESKQKNGTLHYYTYFKNEEKKWIYTFSFHHKGNLAFVQLESKKRIKISRIIQEAREIYKDMGHNLYIYVKLQ